MREKTRGVATSDEDTFTGSGKIDNNSFQRTRGIHSIHVLTK